MRDTGHSVGQKNQLSGDAFQPLKKKKKEEKNQEKRKLERVYSLLPSLQAECVRALGAFVAVRPQAGGPEEDSSASPVACPHF